jgi:N-acetylglucosaminyl-diphospho-decaprenol L-rhamnosyltransferase
MALSVSIAVVSFNTRAVTLRCLTATREAADDRPCALTLVDNGSADGTVEAVRQQHPAWRVIQRPDNPGYGKALNLAFAGSSTPYLLALNSDVLLHVGALESLIRFLDHHPECAIAGAALTYPEGRPQPSVKCFPSLGFALAELFGLHAAFPRNRWLRRFYCDEQDLSTNPWVDTVSGAVMLIRAEAFRRVGGFDEGFRMYFEETDLCRRLHDAGYRVALYPQATSVHWHGASSIQTSVRQVEYYLSYVRYFQKHHGRGPALVLATAVTVITVLRMLALPLKYPPLSRRSRTILRPKLSACWRLLGDLFRPTIRQAATVVRQ